MAKARTAKWRKSPVPRRHRTELEKLLEVLSACDRGVVEFSMGLYNVPSRPDQPCADPTGACSA